MKLPLYLLTTLIPPLGLSLILSGTVSAADQYLYQEHDRAMDVATNPDQLHTRNRARDEFQTPVYTTEKVYGWQMMSNKQRDDYRIRMSQMPSAEERINFRNEHRQVMEQQARSLGIQLGNESRETGMNPSHRMGHSNRGRNS